MIWIIRPLDKQADGFPVLVGISVKDSLSGYFPFPYYIDKDGFLVIKYSIVSPAIFMEAGSSPAVIP